MNSLPNYPLSSPRTVLILGANGRLGCAAAHAFDAAGWRVLAQVRRDPSPHLPAAAVPMCLGLTETSALAAAAASSSVIVHAVSPIYTRWEAEALPSLRLALDLADRLGGHFMLPGNVYNFGASMPALLREDTPARASTRKGQIRVQMEALIAQRAATSRFNASVLRAGDFFGAGTGNWFDMAIVKSLRAGKLVYPGPMDVPHAWAYLPDLADAFVRVAEQPRPEPFSNWHFEGHTLTGAQLLAALEVAAAELGLAPARGWRRGGMPWGVIKTLGVVMPMWRELARMAYLWRVPHALEGRRLKALAADSREATPLPVALRESLLAMGFGARPVSSSSPARERAGAAAQQAAALSSASGSQK
ncbi:SDR family oxidoreductase [soil metagenome]